MCRLPQLFATAGKHQRGGTNTAAPPEPRAGVHGARKHEDTVVPGHRWSTSGDFYGAGQHPGAQNDTVHCTHAPARGDPSGWALGLLSPIPKETGLVSITTLRPICLQNVLFKWVWATVYLMLEDVVAFVTPAAHKAFIKAHFIFDHVWDACEAWEAMQQGLMVSL